MLILIGFFYNLLMTKLNRFLIHKHVIIENDN